MIKVTIDGKREFAIGKNTLDGKEVQWDLIEFHENTFHIIKDNKGYNAMLVSFNAEEKTMVLNVNGTDYEVSIKDKYDLLMQQLGIELIPVDAPTDPAKPDPAKMDAPK